MATAEETHGDVLGGNLPCLVVIHVFTEMLRLLKLTLFDKKPKTSNMSKRR